MKHAFLFYLGQRGLTCFGAPRNDLPKNIELFKNKDLVIVFDKNNDLFRIIQANFTYDAKMLKCVFQYGNIENQIIDRYVRTKPMIDLHVSVQPWSLLDQYRDHFTIFSNFRLFQCSSTRTR